MCGTGHGAVLPCDGVLVDTSAMVDVSIDRFAAIARVGLGTIWKAFNGQAYEEGLVVLRTHRAGEVKVTSERDGCERFSIVGLAYERAAMSARKMSTPARNCLRSSCSRSSDAASCTSGSESYCVH